MLPRKRQPAYEGRTITRIAANPFKAGFAVVYEDDGSGAGQETRARTPDDAQYSGARLDGISLFSGAAGEAVSVVEEGDVEAVVSTLNASTAGVAGAELRLEPGGSLGILVSTVAAGYPVAKLRDGFTLQELTDAQAAGEPGVRVMIGLAPGRDFVQFEGGG